MQVSHRDEQIKQRQKRNFDSRHAAKDLPDILPGDSVWVTNRNSPARVSEKLSPRSYLVHMPEGIYRRNRGNLVPYLGDDEDTLPEISPMVEGEDESRDLPESGPMASNSRDTPESGDTSSSELVTPSPKIYPTRSQTGNLPGPIDHFNPSWTRRN